MNPWVRIARAASLLVGLALAPSAAVADLTFTTIDDPSGYSTMASGVNNSGQVVGSYDSSTSSTFTSNGFLYSNGTYTTINDPLGVLGTSVTGINNRGQIVGYYDDSSYNQHAFLYSNGTYTTLNGPAGSASSFAYGINDSGQIVGAYYNDTTSSFNSTGFVYTSGYYAPVYGPSAGGPQDDFATGINNSGQVVGTFIPSAGSNSSGFLLSNGTYTTLNEPSNMTGTFGGGINSSGQVVGTYETITNFSSYTENAYLYSGGTYSTINAPFPVDSLSAEDINDSGQIVGYYYDTNGVIHAYLATPAVVPEPSSLLMVAIGGAGVAAFAAPRKLRRTGVA